VPPKSPPISPRRLAANRANAGKSTGPRTPEGKIRASQNAVKHGFAASSFAVVRLEDLDEIARLKDDLMAVYRPVNSQELFAIERIALAQQAILRAARLEAGMFTNGLDHALDATGHPMTPMCPELVGDGDIEIVRAQNRNYALAVGFERLALRSNSWSLLLRYQAQAERQFRRAVEEFERLKALRPEFEAELPNEPILIAQPQPPEPDTSSETNPPPPGTDTPPALKPPPHLADNLQLPASSIAPLPPPIPFLTT
jgi:hypothetical protein